MELLYNFMDFVGFSFAVLFVFYWAYAGNLLLHKEARIPVKILVFILMLMAPLFTPLFIYAFYYEPFNRRLRTLLRGKKVNA
jgi:hypothetical protein